MVWDHEVVGSNPTVPKSFNMEEYCMCNCMNYDDKVGGVVNCSRCKTTHRYDECCIPTDSTMDIVNQLLFSFMKDIHTEK